MLLIQHIAWPSGLSSSWWGDPPLSDKRRLLKSHQVCLSVRINELSSTQLSTWRIRMPVMILQLWSFMFFIVFIIFMILGKISCKFIIISLLLTKEKILSLLDKSNLHFVCFMFLYRNVFLMTTKNIKLKTLWNFFKLWNMKTIKSLHLRAVEMDSHRNVLQLST